MTDKPKRVAIYVRVSTEEQAKEGFSIEAQLEKLRAFCRIKGWEIYREYVDDGYTGRDENRPAYQIMLRDIDNWDVLLVLKLDRIHRNVQNCIKMMNMFKDRGKEFASVMESIDTTTAMGRFVFIIFAALAELESEQTGERTKVGMEQKAKKNPKALGGQRPYGYSWNKDPKTGKVDPERPLVINEREARVVRKIFEWHDKGYSYAIIARTLNAKRIPSARGGRWSPETIRKIISRREMYEKGVASWEGISAKVVPPILGGEQHGPDKKVPSKATRTR